MGRRSSPIWIDSARTKTASDVTNIGECEALIRRFARDIAHLHEKIALNGTENKDEKLMRALQYRDMALTLLKKRHKYLSLTLK